MTSAPSPTARVRIKLLVEAGYPKAEARRLATETLTTRASVEEFLANRGAGTMPPASSAPRLDPVETLEPETGQQPVTRTLP